MRGFIILTFLVAAANAGRLGYNYGPGVSGTRLVSGGQSLGGGSLISGGGSLGLGGSSLIGGGGSIGGGSIISGGGSLGLGGSRLVGGGGSIGGGGIISGGGSLGGSGGTTVIGIDAVDQIPQTVEYNKQVFYFSAPAEEQNEGVVSQQLSNVLKKNLQVIFIKAPENIAATNAALQLAKQAIEQRTVIYLLSKENDAAQVVAQLQQIQENVPTVPEVRIIKYRTQDDLINAQASIQAQYDNIGGPSPLLNGGIIPVLNYASGGGSVSGGINVIGGGLGGVQGIGGGIGSVSLGGGSYGTGGTRIIGGNRLSGGVTRVIGGGISSGGGYLPPNFRK